jgi:sigma-E factor negative regulatory protein RseB
MKSLVLCLLLISGFSSATDSLTTRSDEASSWLINLTKSLKERNFSTSFVVVKNNKAEPYHWTHGINADGNELELLSLLNGPKRDILRNNNTVSYIEPGLSAYSIVSSSISSPIPAIFSENTELLVNSYNIISVGRSRVLGRSAQLIRIVSKDSHRYGYWLWLDKDSGLLLKLAVLTAKGELLEQIQFTHLVLDEELSMPLQQVAITELPQVIEVPEDATHVEHVWEVSWLPAGFQKTNANRHRMYQTKQAVEFEMFSDGLVDISVYVSPSKINDRAFEYFYDGATVVSNRIMNNVEVSIVGKIPLNTAKLIANSVVFKTSFPGKK